MNIKEIVEGMTAPQVAQVIKDNFNEVDKDKANKTDLNKSISDLESVVEANKTDLTKKIDNNKEDTDKKLSELGSKLRIESFVQLVFGRYELGLQDNKYITQQGEIKDADGWSCTTFLGCKGLSRIEIKNNSHASGYNCFFDEQQKVIKSWTSPYGNGFVEVPTNAVSFVMSGETAAMESVIICFPKTFIEEKFEELGNAIKSDLGGVLVYAEKSNSLTVGEIYFNYNFIKGHVYKYVNKSSVTDNTLSLLLNESVAQRIHGVSRLGETTFKVEVEANEFGGYYNNTDIDFELYDITDSVQAKPNLIENEIVRAKIDISNFTELMYGKYVDSNGNVQQDSIGGTANPYISNPIKLMFGDTIEATLRVWTSNYPAICEVDSNGNYIPLVKGDSSTSATYKYIADKELSVVVTGWAETNYISKPKIVISKNIKSITNDLYNSKPILEVKEQKYIGFDTYLVNLTKGKYYKYINRSQVSANTTHLRNGEYITQTINAGGKNSSVLFKCENDATNIYGYFNNADRDFVIYEIGESVIEKVNNIFYKKNVDVGSITENNADKIYAMKAAVAAPRPMEYAGVYLPMFMITTDVHGDFGAYMRALDFADEHKEVQCSLMLGDFTTYELPTQNEADGYFMSHVKPVLRLVGNHEIDAEGATLEAIKERFFSTDMIEHNGDIHPNNAMYWHKDIILETDGIHKLRLIGLYQYEGGTIDVNYSGSQLQWLCEKLEEIDSNTHVVILSHYPFGPYNYNDIFNEYFSTSREEFTHDSYKIQGGGGVIEPIVDAWMYGRSVSVDNNGVVFSHSFETNHENQFVCYITGHEHEDAIFKCPKYPKQINVSLITTSGDSRNQVYGDLPRRENDKTRDAVTLFSYDWFNRRINLIRLGSDVTKQMRERKYTSFKLP